MLIGMVTQRTRYVQLTIIFTMFSWLKNSRKIVRNT
jgi:hypothetical protein